MFLNPVYAEGVAIFIVCACLFVTCRGDLSGRSSQSEA
jgi:hypothetical protein